MKIETLSSHRFSVIFVVCIALFMSAPVFSADCNPESDWFPHSQTPEPNHSAFASKSNCEFHQWSWQMFLWLTKNVNGKPLFLSMTSPYDLLDVSSEGLMPRMQKSNSPESFEEYLQAGTDGVMVDQNGKAVYYSQYLNEDFVQFIQHNKLVNPSVVQAFDPDTPFPIGAVELKVSWKVMQPGDYRSDMFVMSGEVNRLENRDGKIVINPNETETVQLGLVGFHVAGVVNGHPEMIWATFEHKDNAPNVPTPKDLRPDKLGPDTVISDKDWTFYEAGTTYQNCNVNLANTNRLTLDEKSQTLKPSTQVCRQFEFGNASADNNSKSDPSIRSNDENIASLNQGVHQKLSADDVWRNYFEVGAIWFKRIDGLRPGMSLENDDILTGSLKLSNATIETYTQDQSTMNNCFRCHNTLHAFPKNNSLDPLPELNLNISHAFQNIYFWSQETLSRKAKDEE